MTVTVVPPSLYTAAQPRRRGEQGAKEAILPMCCVERGKSVCASNCDQHRLEEGALQSPFNEVEALRTAPR